MRTVHSALCLLLLPAACLAADEMLSNPGFEDGLAPWTIDHIWYAGEGDGVSAITVAAGEGREGGAALRIDGAGNRGIAMQTLAAIYPVRFHVTGWIRCEGLGDAAAVIQVEWNGDDGWISASPVGSVVGDADWTFVEAIVEAPYEATSAYVETLTSAPNSGRAWFDDISFVAPVADDVPPGPVVARQAQHAGGRGVVAVEWSDYDAAPDVVEYWVFISEQPFTDVTGLIPAARGGRLSRLAEVGGLIEGRSYHVAVVAVDRDGNRESRVQTTEMTPMDRRAPRSITPWTEALIAPQPAVAVHWGADLLREAVEYEVVWRLPEGEIAGRLPAEGHHRLAALTGLPPESPIEVAVIAFDAAGNGSEPVWVPTESGAASPGGGRVRCLDAGGEDVEGAVVTLQPVPAAGANVARVVGQTPGNLGSVALLVADPDRVDLSLTLPDTDAQVPQVWGAWGTDQVFRDSEPPEGDVRPMVLLAGRGESASQQVVIRPTSAITGLQAWTTDLISESDGVLDAGCVDTQFVGYVHVPANSKATPVEDLVREAPADFPDELLSVPAVNVAAGECQPVFVRVDVPADAAPGTYEGEVWLSWDGGSWSYPLSIEVLDYDFPERTSLLVTNWFNTDVLSTQYGLESEEYWAMLQRLAEMMADHHQNVVLTPLSLVQVYLGTDDEYMYDFSKFDRWVNLFDDAGVDAMIELGHVGSRATGEWECPEFVFHSRPATRVSDGSATTVPVTEFVRAVQDHLRERGWLDRSALHIADEPIPVNEDSWRELSRTIHEAAPDLRRIDAIHVTDLDGDLEVWVPQLNFFDQAYEDLKAKREAGVAEIWFYIAWVPQGPYPNRLLDMETIRTRLIHWMNYLYEAPGYLHWGLNWWSIEMGHFSPGDEWVIWPGEDGPHSSLRYEAQREGIEDYELLVMLEEKRRAAGDPDPRARSVEYAQRLIRSITDYTMDPWELAAVRAELAREVAE